ncbi:50S ribosomal protein L18 [Candidatus Falkowbacteria bacterium]|jgi:large subunit ribosomal protein L18|nr:50S ribosomal protein L18 [Patescibacteria group bacterium]MDD3434903.1 50S ribosomal protein L18 [Patescibacteria group bacterium]MDD4466459.1 50S ribosomal protein L18 [Patescibacteria group bacterium]NCU43015.1 50S ribosomal protein L18 [Candidatus Falkowbacteria bacterium]
MEKKIKLNNERQARRHGRVRAKISGTAARPRLSVFRSNKGLYLQLIDDVAGKTLVSARTKELKETGKKIDSAAALGKLLAEKAQAKKISAVVFDRSCYKYHGRVKAVAEGAREGGLKF